MTGPRRLFGRDADLTTVASALARAGRSTVVGPGGVGKSSLARAVAAGEVTRRTVWVDAEPVSDVDALLDELLRQLGVERLPGQSPLQAAASALDGVPVLVVLDGVEHLADDLAEAVDALPIDSAGPWLLATSRRPVGTSLMPAVRLSPLPTHPDATTGAAMAMMVDELAARGSDVTDLEADRQRWQAVLDATGGLPAAIQLTADHIARFGIRFAADVPVPVDLIIQRCVHRTLGLLTDHERRVFERLGLTAGTFTIDIIAACVGAPASASAQSVAGRLVEHGLLLAVDGRFDLLPPVREGAFALLQQHETLGDALDLLLDWALTLATVGTETAQVVIAANLDTCLHVAWQTVREPARHRDVVGVVHALFAPMYERLRWREFLTLLEALLSVESLDPSQYAETARLAAICASGCDTIAHARRWLDRAQQVATQLNDRALEARTWQIAAWLALDVGDHARAVTTAQHSIALADDAPDVVLPAMRALAETALASGELDRAEALAREVVALTDDPMSFDAMLARTTLGWCLVERGRFAEAGAHSRRLAQDAAHHADLSETSVEAELIALAADPHTEPVAPSLDDNQRFSWWMRLQQRIRIAGRLPIDQHWESVMHTAADVIVLADQVPLAHPRVCATILLGDAALAGDDLRQAASAYQQALRDSARSPYRLRGADAFDGIAALSRRLGDDRLAGDAATAAARIRENVGAIPWPRPSLPSGVTPSGSVPDGWLRDGAPTVGAAETIADALRSPHPAGDPWSGLTHAERQIADLVCAGMSNQEIAEHLVISRRTVESHLSRIFRKLDVRSRTQLATMPIGHRAGGLPM